MGANSSTRNDVSMLSDDDGKLSTYKHLKLVIIIVGIVNTLMSRRLLLPPILLAISPLSAPFSSTLITLQLLIIIKLMRLFV